MAKIPNMANMQGMMKKIQQMQKDMEKEQKAIQSEIFEVGSTNDLVIVKMNGNRQIESLELKPELVDPEDIEMLQDLVIATVNEAIQKVEAETESRLGKYTQGLNLPF